MRRWRILWGAAFAFTSSLWAQYVIPASSLAMAGSVSPFGRWNALFHPAGLAFGQTTRLGLSVGLPYRIPSYRQVALTAAFSPFPHTGIGAALEYEQPHPEQQALMATIAFSRQISTTSALGGAFHYGRALNVITGSRHYLLGSLSFVSRLGEWGWGLSAFNIYGPWLRRPDLTPPPVIRLTAERRASFALLRAEIIEAWPQPPGGRLAVEAHIAPQIILKGGWGFNPMNGGIGIEVKTATFIACFAMGYHQVAYWWPAVEVGYER